MKRFLTIMAALAAAALAAQAGAQTPQVVQSPIPDAKPFVWSAPAAYLDIRYRHAPPGRDAALEKWGLTLAQMRPLTARQLLQTARVADRRDQLQAAFDTDGDPVARFLLQVELKELCFGDGRINRDWCARLADWTARHGLNAIALSDNLGETWFERELPRIGDVFFLGVRGPKDLDRARKLHAYYRDYGDQTDPQWGHAALRSGQIEAATYGNERRVFADYAAAGGRYHALGAYLAGDMLERSPGLAADLPNVTSGWTAETFFRFAGEGGVADARYRYAHLVEARFKADGRAEREDLRRAYDFYLAAARTGHVDAMKAVARFNYRGLAVPENEAAAEDWWIRAARAGDGEAAMNVANMAAARGDNDEAFSWMRRAEQAGYPGAAQRVATWRAAGWREANLGNSLLAVIGFLGDAAAEYNRQQAEELAIQNAWASSVLLTISEGGGSSGGAGHITVPDMSAENARHAQEQADLEGRFEAQREQYAADRQRLTVQAASDDAALQALLDERARAARIACRGVGGPSGPPQPGVYRGSCQ